MTEIKITPKDDKGIKIAATMGNREAETAK
jgi:hypothetical protein